MTDDSSHGATADELSALVRTIADAEARIRELVGDEVDAVSVEGAVEPYLLHPSQRALRHAHQAQRQNAEVLVALIDAMSAHIAVLDASGRILRVNARWAAFARSEGGEPGGFVGADYLVAATAAADVVDGIRAVLEGRTSRYTTVYPCHAPTEKRWFRMEVAPIEAPGPEAALVMHIDVTTLEEAQRRLAASERMVSMASRAARLGGWRVDLDEELIHWSESVCAIHGVPLGTSLTTDEALDFYHPTSRPTIVEAFTRCIRDGEAFDVTAELCPRGGGVVPVRAIGEPVAGVDGRVVAVQGAFQDLTPQVRARQKTERAELRLAQTLESISDGLFMLDRDWRFTFVNAEAERALHRPRADLIGHSLWEAFPETLGTDYEQHYRRAVAEGEVVRFEAFYPPLELWTRVSAHPTDDGLAVYFQDVTLEKTAEGRLAHSEQRFRLVARATSDVVWDRDLTTGEMWWGEGIHEQLGVSPEALTPDVTSWEARVHPDDRARVVDEVARLIEGEGEGDSWRGTYRFQRGDGSYAHVADRGFVMRGEDGRAVRILGGMADRTREQQASRRIAEQAKLLDQAQDAILVRGLDHTIEYWNASARRLYGWTHDEAVGRSIETLLYDDPDAFRAATASVLSSGAWSGEIEQRRKDGTTIVVEGRWTLVRDAHGSPERILAVNTDVTERKKLLAQFLRAQRMESIGTLAGGIAHDLNNMLTPILGSVALLRMTSTDPDAEEMLADMEAAAKRAAELIRQILTFARGGDVGDGSVDAAAAIRDIGRFVRDTFPKQITFRHSLPDDLWRVAGDPTQIHQVMMNLCVNARDAMPEGGELHIAAQNLSLDDNYAAMTGVASAGPHVVIEVSDTGAGMSPETVRQVFDPFFTTKSVGEGTGLGLSTVESIVRRAGGVVTVYSEVGRGTTFKLYLPAREGEASATREVPSGALRRGAGELILVVDDEPSIRAIAAQTLEAFGYRVMTAIDGADAVATFAQHGEEVAVVLTDVMMPIMDGPAAIRALRRMRPDVRIVAASGLNANGGVARAAGAGADFFLPKPYTAEALLDIIWRVLQDDEA